MDIFRFIFLSVVNSMEDFSRSPYDLRFLFFGAVSASLSEFVRFPYDLHFFFFGAVSASLSEFVRSPYDLRFFFLGSSFPEVPYLLISLRGWKYFHTCKDEFPYVDRNISIRVWNFTTTAQR